MILTIIGFVLIGIGLLLLAFEIRGIVKYEGFTRFGGKFIFNMIFGLLTLGIIALGAIMASGVIHL